LKDLDLPSGNVLAMGASLKSTFCRQHRRNVYVSQYLGDLESYDTQQSFRHALDHLTAVLQTPPDTVLLDAHPDYFSTQLGEELAANWGAKTCPHPAPRGAFRSGFGGKRTCSAHPNP
jgi:hydrogenase maturation protein HypF